MPKLNAFVTLYDEGGVRHALKPGDTLPEWAKGRVGDHALDTSGDTDEDTDVDPNDDPDNDTGNDDDDDDKSADEDVVGDTEEGVTPEVKDEAPATPDFTKPAPRTRKKA